jgi:SAM-dependent methyltransferase
MNNSLREYSISGLTLDIGGSRKPDYFDYFKKIDKSLVINLDLKKPIDDKYCINFEKDKLPYGDKEIDNILMFNILEHIFNYNFLISETFRVLKDGSRIIGFVPFMVNYHPDPHDYFRYTREALEMIFRQNGFSEVIIKEIGGSSMMVNFNNIVLSVPIFIRVILFPLYYFLDRIALSLRPKLRLRYPLGYLFEITK